MLDPQEYFKFALGLFALLSPLGAVPIFLSMTQDQTLASRTATARMAVFSTFLILAISLLMGEAILRFFGISLHSFRTGGGILILMMALSMLFAQPSRAKQTPEESEEAVGRSSIAVVPLAMPILAGPGAISSVILFAYRSNDWVHYGAALLTLAALVSTLYPVLRFSLPIARRLGQTGINIITRVMGMILAAIAVEFIAAGIRGLFPGLGGS